jgi:hypothetical protein
MAGIPDDAYEKGQESVKVVLPAIVFLAEIPFSAGKPAINHKRPVSYISHSKCDAFHCDYI